MSETQIEYNFTIIVVKGKKKSLSNPTLVCDTLSFVILSFKQKLCNRYKKEQMDRRIDRQIDRHGDYYMQPQTLLAGCKKKLTNS